MSTPKLDQAREWADTVMHYHDTYSRDEYAAAEVIAALPDQWMDAEKVRNIIHKNTFRGAVMDHRRKAIIEELEDLLDPPLPTLAEMTPEEREKCQWMQADHINEGRCVITLTDPVVVFFEDGRYMAPCPLSRVTPRPDLPRMVWPGSEPDATHVAQTAEEFKQMVDDTIDDEYGTPNPDPQPGEAQCVDCMRGFDGDGHGDCPHCGSVNTKWSRAHTADDGMTTTPNPKTGEAWLVETPGGSVVPAIKRGDGKWTHHCKDHCCSRNAAATPKARLVPETPRKLLVTRDDYNNAPIGTVISYPALVGDEYDHFEDEWIDVAVKYGDNHWRSTGEKGYDDVDFLAGHPREVIWEPVS